MPGKEGTEGQGKDHRLGVIAQPGGARTRPAGGGGSCCSHKVTLHWGAGGHTPPQPTRTHVTRAPVMAKGKLDRVNVGLSGEQQRSKEATARVPFLQMLGEEQGSRMGPEAWAWGLVSLEAPSFPHRHMPAGRGPQAPAAATRSQGRNRKRPQTLTRGRGRGVW